MSFEENRADRLASSILMPKFNIEKAMKSFTENNKFTIYGENIMLPEDRARIKVMANCMGVSIKAIMVKLKNLDFIETKSFDEFVQQDLQPGDFDDSDIEYDRKYGIMKPEQVYLIHRTRREIAAEEEKIIKCPICGFKTAVITTGSQGFQRIKCQKCKLNEPINFSYFRTIKGGKKYTGKIILAGTCQSR